MNAVAVATVFALGCGGGSGGAASYDELAREALAATTKGDAAALMRLADPDTVTRRAFACDGDSADRANAKLKKKVSERAKSAIEALDGLALEVHEVKIVQEPLSFDMATKLDEHCRVEHGNYSRFGITYSTTGKSGVVRNDKAWMDTIELDNRWYLADPPEFGGLARRERMDATPSPDCAHAVGNAHALQKAKYEALGPAALAEILDLRIKRCIADEWEPDARRCLGEARTAADASECINTKLMPQMRVNVDADIDAVVKKHSARE